MINDTVDFLLSLDVDIYRDLVDAEIRSEDQIRTWISENKVNATPEELVSAIRNPKVRDRWISVLTLMKKSVESQIGARRADVEKFRFENEDKFQREYSRYQVWRAGALRFKSGVEARLIEAKLSDPHYNDIEVVKRQRNEALKYIDTLEAAIKKHERQTLDDLDLDPSVADHELWKLAH